MYIVEYWSRTTLLYKNQIRRKELTIKRYCKDVDITDRCLISRAVYDCLSDKYTRRDTLDLFSKLSSLNSDEIYYIYYRANKCGEATHWRISGKSALRYLAEELIDDIQLDLSMQIVEFKPIVYRDQIDSSNGKLRHIGIQDVYQQIYDYIAVYGLQDLFRRFGEYQCASIKGRGQSYGIRAIKRWRRKHHGCKYFGKADVKHCFESISVDRLLAWMNEKVKNPTLMWLVEKLLRTFECGLSIGSYLSQHLCNLYMSVLYHFLSEDKSMFYVRRDKKHHLIDHVLFYMDDIFISGDNAKNLKKAMKLLCKKTKELGLTIKATWFVRDVDKDKFIDMMGVKIYEHHVEIRKCVWKRIRKCMIRINKLIRLGKAIPLALCRKFLSYYGLLKNTNSRFAMKKYKVKKLLKVTKGVVRNESKNRYKARYCPVAASNGQGLYQNLCA